MIKKLEPQPKVVKNRPVSANKLFSGPRPSGPRYIKAPTTKQRIKSAIGRPSADEKIQNMVEDDYG